MVFGEVSALRNLLYLHPLSWDKTGQILTCTKTLEATAAQGTQSSSFSPSALFSSSLSSLSSSSASSSASSSSGTSTSLMGASGSTPNSLDMSLYTRLTNAEGSAIS